MKDAKRELTTLWRRGCLEAVLTGLIMWAPQVSQMSVGKSSKSRNLSTMMVARSLTTLTIEGYPGIEKV